MISDERIAAIRAGYDRCFGCGPANPIGLGLDGFNVVDNGVRATYTPLPDHNGFSDVLHGGIVATALDEVMAWTAILVEGAMVMTGKLDLRYRKPARIATTFALAGEIVDRRGRRITISGKMLDGNVVVASATGLFLVVEELEASRQRPSAG